MYMKLLGSASIMLALGELARAQTPVPGVAAAEEQSVLNPKSETRRLVRKWVTVIGHNGEGR